MQQRKAFHMATYLGDPKHSHHIDQCSYVLKVFADLEFIYFNSLIISIEISQCTRDLALI